MGRAPVPLCGLLGRRARTCGDVAALVGARSGRVATWGDLARSVAHWDEQLAATRAPAGSVVGLAITDPLEMATAILSLVATGRWASPVDPGAPSITRARSWRASRPAVLMTDGSGSHGGVVVERATPDGAPPIPSSHRLDGGILLSSSGTTGTPKLVALDQQRLLHTAGVVVRHHRLTAADRGYNALPLFHVNAGVVALLSSVVAGSSLVLDDRFHRRRFWSVVAEHRVTWVNAVPAVLARLCQPDPDGNDDDVAARAAATVRFVRSASAPLPVPVLRRFEERTGIRVVETYGMTEAGSQICANPVDGPRKLGSVGRPTGVELRIRLADQPCPAGVTGTIEIRGPGVIRAYCTPADDARIDAQGWLTTGDLGYIDADGDVFLIGRTDDVINRGGEKLVPREVEEVLAADPDVESVAVVGWPDPVLGQVPVAFVTVRSGRGRAGSAEVLRRLRDHCAAALPQAKRPMRFAAVTSMPAGPTGKVQRRRLGELDGSSVLAELSAS